MLARVARGPRNYRLRILAEGPTEERLFTEWPMNFTGVVTPGLDFLASYIGARDYRFLQPRAFGLAPELLGLLQDMVDEYPMWPHFFELSRTPWCWEKKHKRTPPNNTAKIAQSGAS